MINAATHEQLTALRELDQAFGWKRHGALSCAHWLSWRVGMTLGPARERVRVATKLGELPLIDQPLQRGELSYSKLLEAEQVGVDLKAGTAGGPGRADHSRKTRGNDHLVCSPPLPPWSLVGRMLLRFTVLNFERSGQHIASPAATVRRLEALAQACRHRLSV